VKDPPDGRGKDSAKKKGKKRTNIQSKVRDFPRRITTTDRTSPKKNGRQISGGQKKSRAWDRGEASLLRKLTISQPRRVEKGETNFKGEEGGTPGLDRPCWRCFRWGSSLGE